MKEDSEDMQVIMDKIKQIVKIRSIAQNKHPLQVIREMQEELKEYQLNRDKSKGQNEI
jgi:hypothetical protein